MKKGNHHRQLEKLPAGKDTDAINPAKFKGPGPERHAVGKVTIRGHPILERS